MATHANDTRENATRLTRAERRTLQTLREEYEKGETDACDGGVSAEHLAEQLDTVASTEREHCNKLVELGLASACWGVKPEPGSWQHRKSWAPVWGDE